MRRSDDNRATAGAPNGAAAATLKTTGPAAGAPPPHVIGPHAVYTLPSAAAALGLAKETLPREIRLGRLEARKRAGRYFVLGQWLLDWLATGEAHHA